MRARAGGGRGNRGEEGFILLESVVAISLIAVLLAALGGFTLNAVSATNELRARQAATHIATSAMAALAAVPATNLVTGRYPSSVDPVWQASPDLVDPWLTDMDPAYDEDTTGATATIPIAAQTQTLNNVTYKVTTYLGRCLVRSATSTDCVTPSLGIGIEHLRAVVAVTWTGRACSTSTRTATNPCAYATATLINKDVDPVFNTNRATPPIKPVVTNPGNQVSTVGAVVAVQLAVDDNTGVPPLTWQLTTGSLPLGLTLSASGLVSGSPTTQVANTPLTVTVMDAFGRTGSATFTWTVVAKPTITTPAAQTSNQGTAVNLAVASTCPHTPCRFTLAGAPAGLSINVNTGAITGTPTTIGASPAVTVTITDADNVSATTVPFSWTVVAGLTISNPAPLNATVGSVKNRALTYTCPTTTCTLTLIGTVPGMGLSTSSTTATNNTTTTLNVAQGSGTIYIAGAIQATAVPTGTSRVYTPTVRITSGATNVTSAPGAWTIFAKPTTAAVTARTVKVLAATNVPITYACPNAPCTIGLPARVPGLGLSTNPNNTATNNTTQLTVANTSGTVYINGTVGATAVPSGQTKTWTVTVTITDADTIMTSSSGTWTASKAPSLTDPGSQAIEPNQTLSLQMATTCPNAGCTWQAAAQVGANPTWYPITISSTGRITYANAPAGSYVLRVIVTDSVGSSDTITFPLTVQTFTFSIPDKTTLRPASGTTVVTYDVSAFVRPLASGYSYTVTGAPAWLVLSNNGTFTATVTNGSASSGTITVTATSRASSTSTVVDSFTWTLQ